MWWMPEYLRWVWGRGLLWAALRILLIVLALYLLQLWAAPHGAT